MKFGLFLVALSGVMWGTSCLFVDLLSPYLFTSQQITALRLGVAFAGMLLYCLFFDRKAFRVSPKDLGLLLLCGSMIYATAALYYRSMVLTSASTSVILMYIAPVPIMLLSVLFLGERFNAHKGIAVALMLLGSIFVSGVLTDFKADPQGILFGFLSAVTYTIYNFANKIAAKKRIPPATSSLYIYLFGAIFAVALCDPAKLPDLIAQRPLYLSVVSVGLGLVTCLFPFLLYSISLKYISVGIASAMSIIEPVTGVLFGIFVFKDDMTVFTVLGTLLVVASVFLLGISESHPKRKG